jgi:antiviral helicase SKI2
MGQWNGNNYNIPICINYILNTQQEFSQIMRLSDAQEGIIVRCIQRLDEVCKDVRKAALIVGSPELAEKMEETSEAIRRDIVFAASLYVTETD